ncbi:MAG: NADPH-adrenodoxin reductase [Watsoniomyces obsoletus]|nr:MAG: NADPH-adrenodoxin reductase [Watsoniomyces obsoletus]
MGVEQPFLYDPPSRNSYVEFNPKAISQASSFQRSRPMPKQEGPLVEFNKHPDSYLILPYGNIDAKPMSRRTRKTVLYTRQFQLMLRCLELLGAVGLMVCVICIRHIDDAMGWTLRIPPAIAMIHCIYAIYHLCRNPTGRTPTSTASYMLFASGLDAVFLPFYVFIALTSNTQYTRPIGKMLWKSVFDDKIADRKIVRAVFLFGVVNGSLHLISLLVSIFLALVFRKIARLPPDMNPLEDNLTSRHKRTKSEMMDKRSSQASTTTTASTTGGSGLGHAHHHSQSQEPLISTPRRSVPFMHTRDSFGGGGGSSNKHQSSPSARNSRADLPSQLQQQQLESRVRLSRSSPGVGGMKRASYDAAVAAAAENNNKNNKNISTPKRSSRTSLVNDNWYTYFNHSEPVVNENLARAGTVIIRDNENEEMDMSVQPMIHSHDDNQQNGRRYSFDDDEDDDVEGENVHVFERNEEETNFYHHESDDGDFHHHHDHEEEEEHEQENHHLSSPFNHTMMIPHPLESNPPTPPPGRHAIHRGSSIALHDGSSNRHHHHPNIASKPGPRPGSTSNSPGFPKAKLYGDLKPQTPPVMMTRMVSGKYVDVPLTTNGGGRVVSNSGADFEYSHLAAGSGTGGVGSVMGSSSMMRTRDVSGKVAEEGRGDGGWNARMRRISGRA